MPATGSSVRTDATSTPAASMACTMKRPSAPVQPQARTRAPHRPAATAWLAPFPPGNVRSERAATVCPGRGSAATDSTRSIIREAMT